ARLLLRGFQGGELLRQSLGTVSGVVVVRVDRRCRAHEQPCGTHPAFGRAMAEERLWLPQRGGESVCGADVDRGPNPEVAETPGAGLPVSRVRAASIRPARPAITGPGGGVNGYKKRIDRYITEYRYAAPPPDSSRKHHWMRNMVRYSMVMTTRQKIDMLG